MESNHLFKPKSEGENINIVLKIDHIKVLLNCLIDEDLNLNRHLRFKLFNLFSNYIKNIKNFPKDKKIYLLDLMRSLNSLIPEYLILYKDAISTVFNAIQSGGQAFHALLAQIEEEIAFDQYESQLEILTEAATEKFIPREMHSGGFLKTNNVDNIDTDKLKKFIIKIVEIQKKENLGLFLEAAQDYYSIISEYYSFSDKERYFIEMYHKELGKNGYFYDLIIIKTANAIKKYADLEAMKNQRKNGSYEESIKQYKTFIREIFNLGSEFNDVIDHLTICKLDLNTRFLKQLIKSFRQGNEINYLNLLVKYLYACKQLMYFLSENNLKEAYKDLMVEMENNIIESFFPIFQYVCLKGIQKLEENDIASYEANHFDFYYKLNNFVKSCKNHSKSFEDFTIVQNYQDSLNQTILKLLNQYIKSSYDKIIIEPKSAAAYENFDKITRILFQYITNIDDIDSRNNVIALGYEFYLNLIEHDVEKKEIILAIKKMEYIKSIYLTIFSNDQLVNLLSNLAGLYLHQVQLNLSKSLFDSLEFLNHAQENFELLKQLNIKHPENSPRHIENIDKIDKMICFYREALDKRKEELMAQEFGEEVSSLIKQCHSNDADKDDRSERPKRKRYPQSSFFDPCRDSGSEGENKHSSDDEHNPKKQKLRS